MACMGSVNVRKGVSSTTEGHSLKIVYTDVKRVSIKLKDKRSFCVSVPPSLTPMYVFGNCFCHVLFHLCIYSVDLKKKKKKKM